MEPAHHHSFGHNLVVIKGRKSTWNLKKEERYDLEEPTPLDTDGVDDSRRWLLEERVAEGELHRGGRGRR
ncbi:DNA-damage-repair/toleration protein DRT102 [Spatholobus suberectus]|nr:DNA-damage-repair/toleration protein DRT102 [Spatholobus suberectus]